MNEGPSKLPVNLNVEVAAKATLDVKAEIPAASAGRFVDAITDLVRPWSESRGLKADIIRLHREDVALKIAQVAAERIAVENRQVHPVPLKLLIPLLEKGSQERADDEFMIGMWASLLASSALDDAVSPRFVSILGELNSRQARLFLNISGRSKGLVDFRGPDTVSNIITNSTEFRPESIDRWLRHENILKAINDELGIYVTRVQIMPASTSMTLGGKITGGTESHFFGIQSKQDELDVEILESVGLAKKFAETRRHRHYTYNIYMCTLTPLGFGLLNVLEPSDA